MTPPQRELVEKMSQELARCPVSELRRKTVGVISILISTALMPHLAEVAVYPDAEDSKLASELENDAMCDVITAEFDGVQLVIVAGILGETVSALYKGLVDQLSTTSRKVIVIHGTRLSATFCLKALLPTVNPVLN